MTSSKVLIHTARHISEPLLVTRHGKIVFKNCVVKGNDINELSY